MREVGTLCRGVGCWIVGTLLMCSRHAIVAAEPGTPGDRLEPGLQGHTAFGRTGEYPRATVCERHTTGGPRSDSRSRFECSTGPWVDRCAYVSSTGGVFPIIGILQGDEALLGVAVIDVSNPQSPKTVELLRSWIDRCHRDHARRIGARS